MVDITDVYGEPAPRPAPAPESDNQKLSKDLRKASSLYREGRKDGAAQAREDFARELLWYCRKAMESDSMLYECDHVPMTDVEYAAIQLRDGKSLRQQEAHR